MRAPRSVLGVGVVLFGLTFAHACQSSPSGRPNTGMGGAGRGGTGASMATGGSAGIEGSAATGGGAGTEGSAATGGGAGIGGSAATGAGGIEGTGATGGQGGLGGTDACPGVGGFHGTPPCGPAPSCEGNTLVRFEYCDPTTCAGPSKLWRRTDCPNDTTCGGGKCLTHVAPPSKTCAIATDCGLPATVCVGASEQLIFSDPSCDDGQCHWKQIVNTCGVAYVSWQCTLGTCYDPGMQTRGPINPMPSPDPMQPPPAPDAACAASTDCARPPPVCYRDSVVSYVHPSCRAGACSWEIDLNECANTCAAGVCVTP